MVRAGSQSVLGNISRRSATQNLKIAHQFSANLSQFSDPILKSNFVMRKAAVTGAPSHAAERGRVQDLETAA